MASKEREFFLQNLNLLMRSALPVREAIATLKEEIRSKRMLRAIGIVESEIDSGTKISAALGASGLLAERYVALLRLGEETGELQKQLALVVEEQKKEANLHAKIRGALIYPAIVILITICVGIFMMWYIVPKLTAVFSQSGGQLPLSTRVLIGIGNFFISWGIIAVPLGFAAAAALIYFLFMYKHTRIIGESFLFSIPTARTIIQGIELARFGYITGSMLRAGISLPQALVSMRDSTSFVLYKRFYARLYTEVTEGNSLYKSIQKTPRASRYIPSYVSRLLSAGEMSGSLSDTLVDVGAMYEEKTEALAQNLSTLLEPLIIVVVGISVAFLAVSIIAPIYGLSNQIS